MAEPFKQDRWIPRLWQPNNQTVVEANGLFSGPVLVETEPGLYAFDGIAFANGYTYITPYNVEVA